MSDGLSNEDYGEILVVPNQEGREFQVGEILEASLSEVSGTIAVEVDYIIDKENCVKPFKHGQFILSAFILFKHSYFENSE